MATNQRGMPDLRRLVEHAGLESGHVLPLDRVGEGLHTSLRSGIIEYFRANSIKWWLSKTEATERRLAQVEGQPTGNLKSSQIACVNHLGPARTDADRALAIAKSIDPAIDRILPVPNEPGFVAFEWIPPADLLNEGSARTRGANSTSLDALMLGAYADGRRVLLAIEWKFFENYGNTPVARRSSRGTDRLARYASLLSDVGGPIECDDPLRMFFEPYYQLMRQTLLAWQLTQRESGAWLADDWLHVQVIPESNQRLRSHVPVGVSVAGHLSLESAWREFLREPVRYRLLSPSQLVPSSVSPALSSWRHWLTERYAT